MIVVNTTLSANSAPLGGGILNQSTMTVVNCTFSGNSATGGFGGLGGGIYNSGHTDCYQQHLLRQYGGRA